LISVARAGELYAHSKTNKSIIDALDALPCMRLREPDRESFGQQLFRAATSDRAALGRRGATITGIG